MHAICQCDVRRVRDDNFDQAATSFSACQSGLRGASAGPANRLNQPNLFLPPSASPLFPFSLLQWPPLTLPSIHLFPYSSIHFIFFRPPLFLSLFL